MAFGLPVVSKKTLQTNMADDDEETNRQENQKKRPEWKETCLGIWTRGTKVKGANNDWICNGISIVQIDKNARKDSIKLSKTRGLQVIIHETDNDQHRPQDKQNDTDDRERDPQRHTFPPDDPDLGEKLIDVFRKKKEKIEKNVENIIAGKTSPSDVWAGFSGLMVSWYQTGYRIISYCKPKEKVHQMYNFASNRVKEIRNQWKKK